jgi:hypothetical protein
MATEEVKTNPELEAPFTQLAAPFDPSEIKWRVTHTTRDGSRGEVIAFADPRAYTDRLNQLFTPTGWTRTYVVSTVSSVTRMKKDALIQTGKVLVTCTLTITGLGCHAGSGEDWADEQNAMTSAEAQAFKRACTCFGRSISRHFHHGCSQNQARSGKRAIPLPAPGLPRYSRGLSIRRRRRRSKASDGYWGIRSTARSSGESLAHGGRMPSRMHSSRWMLSKPWSAQLGASTKRTPWRRELGIPSSSRCWTGCRSGR